MATMSESALARCRRLYVVEKEKGDNFLTLLVVVDPVRNKIVESYRCRHSMDVVRVSRTFRSKYRIPVELVFNKSPVEDGIEFEGQLGLPQ